MKRFLGVVIIAALCSVNAQTANVFEGPAVALQGDLKYGPDFTHFGYTNPDAPKGGAIRLSATGSYDTLNPYTLEGVSASGTGLTYDALMVQSNDEAFSMYGLLAETIRFPENSAWVEFDLRPEAQWHDGEPVTAEDVVFTFNTLVNEGNPFYASYYASVSSVEAKGERTVRFTFEGETNRELPLIVGQLPVLPQHYWEGKDFASTTLEPPLGSGPYRIGEFDAGRSITYERVPDYWGADLPVRAGMNNFGTIRYDYYRDDTVALEALKAYDYDFRTENSSSVWATGYDVPAVQQGQLVQELISNERPTGMQAFWFNTRRDKFTDPKVREALGYAFDFEWSNKNLFYDQYTRTNSFFSNSELASSGLPEGQELELLEPYRDQLPAEVFTEPFSLPTTDGSGNLRESLRTASQLLSEAGWEIQNGSLTNTASGEVMKLEVLLYSPSFERIVAPMVQNMERLGVEASYRTVEPAQFQELTQNFNYDLVFNIVSQSLSPGNEQRDFWNSQLADIQGGRNYAGVKNPVVDALIGKIINAPNRETLVAATHALDRVLLWNHYVIPNWYFPATRVAYWDKFGKPEVSAKYSVASPDTWWLDEAKLAELNAAR